MYSNCKIYFVLPKSGIENGTPDKYVGSTYEKLNIRYIKHKSAYKNNGKYCYVNKVFEKYGVENCDIILVEDWPCENKK